MKTVSKLLAATLMTGFSSLALANVGGLVDVSLEVATACNVNGSEINGNMNKFGNLNFGKTGGTWTNVLTAELQSSGTGGGIEVVCEGTENIPFTVAIDGGTRSDRTLMNIDDKITAKNMVEYNVYRDVARTIAYVKNEPQEFVAKGSEATKIPVYGSIAPNADAVAKGTYKDTLLVNVAF